MTAPTSFFSGLIVLFPWQVVDYLLERGADAAMEFPPRCGYPLALASYFGQVECVHSILQDERGRYYQ